MSVRLEFAKLPMPVWLILVWAALAAFAPRIARAEEDSDKDGLRRYGDRDSGGSLRRTLPIAAMVFQLRVVTGTP